MLYHTLDEQFFSMIMKGREGKGREGMSRYTRAIGNVVPYHYYLFIHDPIYTIIMSAVLVTQRGEGGRGKTHPRIEVFRRGKV